MSRCLFLDIDGVLNAWEGGSNDSHVNEYIDFEPSKVPVGWRERSASSISSKKVGILNEICKATNTKIIISSSWRSKYGFKEIEKLLKFRGFTGEVVGATPALYRDVNGIKSTRGDEIKAWINARLSFSMPEFVLILEDYEEMGNMEQHTVRTDSFIGLLPGHLEYVKTTMDKFNWSGNII